MLAFILAAIASVSPSPKPTPQLKVIVNVRSSSLCTAVRETAVPIAFVTHRDDQAFAAMNHSMLKFMERIQGVTPASAAEMHALENGLDDSDLYTPSAEMSVVQMDKIAYEVMQNLTLEDHFMDASWKQYPRGQFANLDALRQRLQNLMDLQRALANNYMSFTGIYLDNRGQARFADDSATFKMFLRATILGLSSALADVRTDGDPEAAAQASAHEVARHGNVTAVVKELRLQEYAFANEVATAAKTCGI